MFVMIRFLIVLIIFALILVIFWNRNKKDGYIKKSNFYKNFFIILIIGGLLFFLATSGKFILPQIMQILKIGLPFITKFIGIL